MIDGVKVKTLQVHTDERGLLMEMLRCDDPDFQSFGQVYVTMVNPGVAKAWHYHKKQTDHFVCLGGTAKIVLHDTREGSPTKGETNEFVVGWDNQQLIIIPKDVYHGFTAAGTQPAFIVNIPTEPYSSADPDEYRLAYDDATIGYDWGPDVVMGG
ncbi:MAG: dTDP-4-dehydrorhamnose 3,5-epimerase [Coriobacteriia bacterium]|nr:dTDP-4-dehydrorhamnose 3,5-epimerase [Coriobacteriia bacterium]